MAWPDRSSVPRFAVQGRAARTHGRLSFWLPGSFVDAIVAARLPESENQRERLSYGSCYVCGNGIPGRIPTGDDSRWVCHDGVDERWIFRRSDHPSVHYQESRGDDHASAGYWPDYRNVHAAGSTDSPRGSWQN